MDRRPRRIVIFEPRAELAAGAAYSTDEPGHLLNAPARSMSALEDDPTHFVGWLEAHHPGWGPEDFVPRRLYRRYLQDVMATSRRRAAPGTEVIWVQQLVTSLSLSEGSSRPVTTLTFGYDQELKADTVVLALGAPAPVALSALDVSPTFGMIGDPWVPGTIDAMAPSGDVLILGTGLTMIDVALVLAERDPGRTIHARSRHGLLPTEHASDGFAPWPAFDIGRPATAREVFRGLRRMMAEAEAEGANWRNVVAAARTAAPEVWARLPEGEQRRVLRHLGRRWEVLRHRMSVPVAASVTGLRRSGRLTVGAGRVEAVVNHGSFRDPRLEVTLAGPGGRREVLTVGALIDCTGPGRDATVGSPLVAGMFADGTARAHPSGIGLDVDENGDLLDASGTATSIHTVGWCRRGAEFESTAVPEIRGQADRLARHVARTSGRRAAVLADA
jgi:uncharacterized NAD(P)/FAD-binding protein YdhS